MNEFAKFSPSEVKYDVLGLVPCIVEDAAGGVRMLGYMNSEALGATLASGYVTFFSRSKNRLWKKGESSGHTLKLVSLHLDCDHDTLLARAICAGPTCHSGSLSCFADMPSTPGGDLSFLLELEALLQSRKLGANGAGSYTEKLLFHGVDRIGKKVIEEAGEVVIAAKNLSVAPAAGDAAHATAHATTHATTDATSEFLGEAADLLFHLQLLLVSQGHSLSEVLAVMRERHKARQVPVQAAHKSASEA